MSPALARTLGLGTAAYGAYTLARPSSLARMTGRADDVRTRRVAIGIGVRDLLSGVSMIAAPAGTPLRTAVGLRVACDVADAVGFGATTPASHRRKVVAIAAAWAALCACSFRGARS